MFLKVYDILFVLAGIALVLFVAISPFTILHYLINWAYKQFITKKQKPKINKDLWF